MPSSTSRRRRTPASSNTTNDIDDLSFDEVTFDEPEATESSSESGGRTREKIPRAETTRTEKARGEKRRAEKPRGEKPKSEKKSEKSKGRKSRDEAPRRESAKAERGSDKATETKRDRKAGPKAEKTSGKRSEKKAEKSAAKSAAKSPAKSAAKSGSRGPATDGDVLFSDLEMSEEQLETLANLGYEKPTPVQAQTLPIALEGRDCIGQAPTGTGKTAAFMLPILEQLDHDARGVQAIVLSPTRELAEQVASEAERLADGRAKFAVIVGGRPMGPQRTALERGAQIVVGTPGRVIDLINRGILKLGDVRFAVLDEADRMLDFGFRPDIEKILRRCPKDRQTLLFSATMPKEVMRLVDRYQKSPEVVDLSEKTTSEQVEQYVCSVDRDKKFPLLVKLLTREKPRQVIVFTRTKRGADKLAAQFSRALDDVDVLHGDLPQSKRDRVMKRFRGGLTRMLIATDIVGRGIDVSYVSHIVNYDVPEDCDDYVHRVGRTGRLSSKTNGKAYTFATREDGNELTRIEQRINRLLEPYDFGLDVLSDRKKEVREYTGRVTDNEIADDFGDIE